MFFGEVVINILIENIKNKFLRWKNESVRDINIRFIM